MGKTAPSGYGTFPDPLSVMPLGLPPTEPRPAENAPATPGFGAGSPTPELHPSKGTARPAVEPLMPNRAPSGVASPARPTPLPKRPKGRLFMGTILLSLCAIATYAVWNTWLRFEAYGIVVGRIIHVSPAAGGVIKSLHVREGDVVRQGQLLVTLDDLQLQQQTASLGDALRIAQANLDAEIAMYRVQAQQQGDMGQKAQAEYISLWGELLAKRSEIESLQSQLQRAKKLVQQGAASVEEMERLQFQLKGETAKIEKLETAVAELKKRAKLYEKSDSELQRRCKPQLVRIETLQGEFKRLRERLQQGEIRSLVNGRIVRVARFAGEYAETGQDILEILEDGSLEIALYLPQNQVDRWKRDDEVSLHVDPKSESVSCVVDRIGDALETAPPCIKRYYRSEERLVPLYLRPKDSDEEHRHLRLGSEVRLPYLL
jgi:multidrug resistance efflux pump